MVEGPEGLRTAKPTQGLITTYYTLFTQCVFATRRLCPRQTIVHPV